MKEYPSIPRSTGQTFQEIPGAYIFDKPDGSNIRVEGSRKKGWYKFGSRTQLIDHTHTFLGAALSVFARDHNEILSKMLKDERWDSVTVFGEFYGPSSFAGWHDVNEPVEVKHYSIFDISPYKKGILGPKEFLRLQERYGFDAPIYRGQHNWTRGFVEAVYNGEIECAFEGVVGKAGEGHHLVRAKAKTKAWIDKVMEKLGQEEGTKIVNS